MQKEIRQLKLNEYAIKLFVKKRYTENELRKKLNYRVQKSGFSDELDPDFMIDETIGRLKELGYIDDYKYALDYAREKSRLKLYSKLKIKTNLLQKGIDEVLIYKAIDQALINEEDSINKLIEKKIRSIKKYEEFKQKQKLLQFLQTKGFQGDSIYKAIKEYYSKKDY